MHCVVHFIALWTINQFIYFIYMYIAAEIYIWLEKKKHIAVSTEKVTYNV